MNSETEQLTELEQHVYNFVVANPKSRIIDVSAEFDISPDEAIRLMKSIRGKMKKDEDKANG